METPGEPEAGPLGAPSLSNFAPGHPEREKLVKLEGQPGGAGRDGSLSQGREGGKGRARVPPPGPLLQSGDHS